MYIRTMRKQMTKREARKLMGAATDHALSKALGTTHQAIYKWGGDDDLIPQQRVWQIQAILAERREAS
jgi:hypothetical protein